MFSLIIEIQSGMIRGAIVKDLKSGQPVFVDVKVASIRSPKLMLETLVKVIEELGHKHKVHVAHIILSSPWISSFSKSIELHFEKEREVTENLILNIIKEENDKIKKDLESCISIEQKIFEIRSNGYVVDNYESLSSENLGLSFVSTFSSQNLIKKINDIVEQAFSAKEIQYHSGLLLNSLAIRDFDSNKGEYIHINMHGEITDIIVIKNNKCLNISSFPIGIESLNRYMAHNLNQSEHIAKSTMKLGNEGKLGEEEQGRLDKFTNAFLETWIGQYRSLLESSFGNNLPKDVYFLSYDHHNHFKKVLESKMKNNVMIQNNPLDMYIISLRNMI